MSSGWQEGFSISKGVICAGWYEVQGVGEQVEGVVIEEGWTSTFSNQEAREPCRRT